MTKKNSYSYLPLAGVPIVVKDNLHVANHRCTAGTPALDKFVPSESAIVVKRLEDAGAIVLGKTNLHELAYGITSKNCKYGHVRNPKCATRIPGGSSGGSGAAIGAGYVPGGLGTDTGGSIRIPAALCGICGFRPTAGGGSYRVEPVVGACAPISHTRDVVGPMAQCVEDLIVMDAVMRGEEDCMELIYTPTLENFTLGTAKYFLEPFFKPLEPRLKELWQVKISKLGEMYTLVDVDVIVENFSEVLGGPNVDGTGYKGPFGMPGGNDGGLDGKVSFPICFGETKSDLTKYLDVFVPKDVCTGYDELVEAMEDPAIKGLFVPLEGVENTGPIAGFAEGAPARETYQAAIRQHRGELQVLYHEVFDQDIDAVIFPTVTQLALHIDDPEADSPATFPMFIHNTDPGSNAGLPGVTLPLGEVEVDGEVCCVGLGMDGPPGSDRKLLQIALALQKALKTF